jgi:probable F420-dependent oxidoreductase
LKEGSFMMKKAFRFGVVTGGHTSRASWVALAQRVEELGYSSLLIPDVLGTPLATMTALAVAATATTTLRVGSYVFVNDYRNPALLARDIATLDLLSDGRVELGLGAGNWPLDFQQIGIPFDEAGVRVSRFAEGLSIIKQFFTSETVNFSGKYYTTTALHPVPRPVQQPHPPIVIGSAGRRMLTMAAREADIIMPVSIQRADSTSKDASLEEKIGWIREAADERFEHLELGQAAFGIEVTDSSVALPPPFQRGGIPTEARPMSTEQAIEYLLEQREHLGISYIHIQERQLENFTPVLARLNGK